jgi:hypothetical protein
MNPPFFSLARMAGLACLIAAAACLAGCASDPDPLDVAFGLAPVKQLSAAQQERMLQYPLGSAENPVRAHMPEGERAYLERLRCADGSRPAFERHGSAGQLSPYDTVMDIYGVTCGIQRATVFIDMYHPNHVEVAAVPGFTIDPDDSSP